MVSDVMGGKRDVVSDVIGGKKGWLVTSGERISIW